MSGLRVLLWPDKRLSVPCTRVTSVTPAVERLARDMLITMYMAEGRGLAAPQVGVLLRLFVMDIGWKEGRPSPGVFINPIIEWSSPDTAAFDEGCLSIPGVTARVTRPKAIGLRWQGLDGLMRSANFEGFGAVCVQHEADHLDGRVTFDRLSLSERAELETQYAG